jgi:hypothetical protein
MTIVTMGVHELALHTADRTPDKGRPARSRGQRKDIMSLPYVSIPHQLSKQT